MIMDGEIYTKDGLRFLRLKDIEANPTVRDLVIKANGIFPDPELGMFVSSFGFYFHYSKLNFLHR